MKKLCAKRLLQFSILMLGVAMVILSGCSKSVTVEVPPKVNLKAFQTIGVIEFSSNTDEKLNRKATQNFMQSLQNAQPGVLLLELGSKDKVLRSVRQDELNLDAVKAIKKKYGVDAVVTGVLEISEVKPNVQFNKSFTSLSAKAYVNGALSAKLWHSASGATVWTNSSHGKWSVANLNVSAGNLPSFGVSDPEEKYGKMVNELVYALTGDFRPTYVKKVVED